MHSLLARATGHDGGPRVRPVPTRRVAAQVGWGESDDSVDAPLVRAEAGAQPLIERAASRSAARANASPPRLQPRTSAPVATAVPSVRDAVPDELAPQAGPGRPAPAAQRDDAAPIEPPRNSTAEPAAALAQPRRPAPLQAPRVAQPLQAPREHTALAAPTPTRGGRLQAEPPAVVQARDTESVVHVSIGRVELTALVAPPATRPKAPPRHPTTSLADYLRAGAGAGGRK